MSERGIAFIGYDRDGHRVFQCPNGNYCTSFHDDLPEARYDVLQRFRTAVEGGRAVNFGFEPHQFPHGPIHRRKWTS